MKKINAIYCDFNGIDGDFVGWSSLREWKLLLRIFPDIEIGDTVYLWSDDSNEKNEKDNIITTGVFTYNHSEKKYGFQVNLDIKHESDFQAKLDVEFFD